MILVFGASGQTGEELSLQAVKRGVPLTALPRAAADISDASAVADAIARSRPSVVVNAAGYTKVDLAETEPDKAFGANATGPAVLARACAQAGLPLVTISTDYIFDGTKRNPYTEDDPISPLGVYGRSKAAGEAAVRSALAQHVILRTSWVYGRFGANFLKTVLRLAREKHELTIVADQRGCPTGTADIAEAILTIAPRLADREPVWGTYNFAGGGATTWYEFAVEIVEIQAKMTGRKPPVRPVTTAEYPTAARRPANSELDCSRFRATFGFSAIEWRKRTRDVVASLVA